MAARKLTTGIAGLPVAKNPLHSLDVVYNKIARVLRKMPQDAMYRQYTEELLNSRLSIIKSETDAAVVEEKLGAGQLEELISQAEGELKLARNMLEWKPWEPLVRDPPKGQWKWPI